ncbi:Carbamate kinase [Giardia muris]|uniref:Carbamate kinase n=1 Tax=Giardia muris TaxID=5742 RepID=A0A4Z1STC3_GIAMU|nr:Carbamate kinase [Giardia muris]|eukprot:TNJ29176.1 Carbamate kinase [Giardia muris]
MKTVVIALGGNAMLQPGQKGDFEVQLENVKAAIKEIHAIHRAGYRVVLTSGNGPQVGAIKLQNQSAASVSPEMPLYACGAMSQGLIGYMMVQELRNAFRSQKEATQCIGCLTQTLVDSGDPAFAAPSKPMGRFYTEEEARAMMAKDSTIMMKEDAGRGWRVVVPSPRPVEILEYPMIKKLVDDGVIVICTNGGGIPCKLEGERIVGVDAVIDKDMATSLLAQKLNSDYLLILTDVPYATINYRTSDQQEIKTVTVEEMMKLEQEGHFKDGSMKPKVRAAIEFTMKTGNPSIITSLTSAFDALEGNCGTRIVQ